MTEYDTLRIKIVANAGSALDTVERFSSRLKDLEKTAEKLDFTKIEKLEKILRDIASIDLTKVSSGLYSVAKSFETLAGAASKGATALTMNEVGEIVVKKMAELEETTSKSVERTAEKIENVAKSLENVSEKAKELESIKPFEIMGKDAETFLNKIKDLQKVQDIGPRYNKVGDILKGVRDYENLFEKEKLDFVGGTFIDFERHTHNLVANLGELNYGIENIEKLGDAMQKAGLNGTQMESVIKTIGQETREFNESQIELVRQKMDELGFSAEQIAFTLTKLKAQSDTTTKAMDNGISKVVIKFKSLAIYRVLRLVLMKIQQAVGEAIKNLSKADPEFNAAISSLMNSFTYLANALVAGFAPILKALTPIISILATALGNIANSIGQIISTVLGYDFYKAAKGAEDYAKSLKEVKNLTLGIDELNILQDEKDKNFFIEVDTKELDNAEDKLRKISALVSGVALLTMVDWKGALLAVRGAIETLIPKISLLSINWKGFALSVAGSITAITSFVSIMKDGLNWSNLATLILGCTTAVIGLNAAFHSLNLTLSVGLIASLLMVITSIIDIVKNGINWQNGILLLVGVIGTIIVAMKAMASTAGILTTAIAGLVSTIAVLTAGVVLFITMYNKIKDSWANMNMWQKISGGIGLVLIAIGTLVATVSAFLQQWHIFAIAVAGVAVGTAMSIGAYKTASEAPKFETGGFPEDGFFFANHNELVGKFSNGKTAVANNEQITEGIYQAVLSAMNDSDKNNGKDIVMKIDGREIARIVKKYDEQQGDAGFVGGFKYVY